MNILHAAIRFNPAVLPLLIEFIENKLYLSTSQKKHLMNGQTLLLEQSPLHFAAKYGTNDSLCWLFHTNHSKVVDLSIGDSSGKLYQILAVIQIKKLTLTFCGDRTDTFAHSL